MSPDIANNKQYQIVHHWLITNHGKANKCESDTCTGKSKRFEWSLKKGKEYEKIIDNYWQLCKSCHVRYDFTEGTREKMRQNNLGAKRSEATKLKMSQTRKGRKLTEEHKKSLSESKLKRSKPITND